MSHPNSPALKEQVVKAVKEQIKAGKPPETGQTHERLIAEGYSQQEVLDMLVYVLTMEIHTIIRDKRPFDMTLYINNLHRLPELPR